ncbi:MAG: DedA family protein [Planctomycetes bacterium]|nr:DedA family protein [Planctomycetota bacterium]
MIPEFTHNATYYGLILAWLWFASLGVPIPEDIALLSGGYCCYMEWTKVWLMIPVAMFGVLSGDLFIFYLGRRWADNLFEHRYAQMIAKPDRIIRLKQRFLRHQIKTVFVGRFLPGMRALVFLTAGSARMSVWKFLAVNGFAALISVPAFVALGYLFGASFDQIKQRVTEVKHIVILVVVGLGAVWYVWYLCSRWTKARERRLLNDEKNNDKKHVNGSDSMNAIMKNNDVDQSPKVTCPPESEEEQDRPH